jgi:putative transposase
MIAFIDAHRGDYGVEPICRVLPIAPSTYHDHAVKQRDPSRLPSRAQRDLALKPEILRVHAENFGVYGVRKVWRQMRREGFEIARCTVERLMRELGLQGVVRGKPVRTTVSDKAAPCPLDQVNRQFHAPRPNRLWVADFTYVATWAGFVYVAFVIDVYARYIVGWRVSRTAHAGFVLDALEQAIHERRPNRGGLVHHSDRGSQYLSIKYTERLAEAGIEPSVGSVGDSYDNALAETINGLYKAEVIHRRVAILRSRRIRDIGMGRLVQQQAAARTHRERTASRSRKAILRDAERNSRRRITQTKRPPAIPGRFRYGSFLTTS